MKLYELPKSRGSDIADIPYYNSKPYQWPATPPKVARAYN